MRYPKHLSADIYCKNLIEKYRDGYSNFITEKAIEESVGYVVTMIRLLLDNNRGGTRNKTLEYISNTGKLTVEAYKIALTEINACESAYFLFLIIQKPAKTAGVIQKHMDFSVSVESQEQYLEFIKKVVLQCAQELAAVNQPKLHTDKKVIFSIDLGSNLDFEEVGSQNTLEESKEAEETQHKKKFISIEI